MRERIVDFISLYVGQYRIDFNTVSFIFPSLTGVENLYSVYSSIFAFHIIFLRNWLRNCSELIQRNEAEIKYDARSM